MPDGSEHVAVASTPLGVSAGRLAERGRRDPARREPGERVDVLDEVLAGDHGAPAAVSRRGRRTGPRSMSSCGASLVTRRVCGSSVCQHAASLGTTRRRRALTSAKYSSRGSPRLPSCATSSASRSICQRPAGTVRVSPRRPGGVYASRRKYPRDQGIDPRARCGDATRRQPTHGSTSCRHPSCRSCSSRGARPRGARGRPSRRRASTSRPAPAPRRPSGRPAPAAGPR